MKSILRRNRYIFSSQSFFGTTIAVNILVLSKHKSNNKTLTDIHIAQIMDAIVAEIEGD